MATPLLARRLGGFLGSIFRILVLSWAGRPATPLGRRPTPSNFRQHHVADIIHDPALESGEGSPDLTHESSSMRTTTCYNSRR